MIEVTAHRGPLRSDDAVDARVAQRAVRRATMVAQDAIELRAQALDGAPALLVEEMSPELHRDALELLERVSQQQQLAFGVQRRALYALAVPRRADLHASVD